MNKEQALKKLYKMRDGIKAPYIPKDFNFLGPPRYNHQLVAFWYGMLLERCGLFMDMGTGKTASAIDVASYRIDRKDAEKALVVSPTTVLYNWQNEIKKFSDKKAEVLYGPITQRKELLFNTTNDFYIINYEALRLLENDLIEKTFDVIIFDESTRIKTPTAKMTKSALRIVTAIQYRLLLSGQPIANTPLDLYSQYLIMDGGETFGNNYFRFRNKYFLRRLIGGRFPKWEIRKNAFPIITKHMYKSAVRYLIEDCVDLPNKTYQKHFIEMGDEQATLYNSIKKKVISDISKEITASEQKNKTIKAQVIIAKMMKLAQICSGFIYDENKKPIILKTNPKLKILLDILNDLILDRKVVVWCKFKASIDIIAKALKKAKISHLTYFGEHTPQEKQKIQEKLQLDEKIRVLIGQERSGIGQNFTAASYTIYYENEWSSEARNQSERRVYRIGQERKTVVIDLIMQNTVEVNVINALKNKIKIASVLMKDPISFLGEVEKS